MEWITKEEIARRGKISPYEAFTISILKYEQWLCTSAKELKEAIYNGKTSCSAFDYCGCCMFYSNCRVCPLDDEGDTCCVEWRTLDRGDQANKDSIRAMLCRLYQERDKLPKEEKKPCKEEKIRHGDCGWNKDGEPIFTDDGNYNLGISGCKSNRDGKKRVLYKDGNFDHGSKRQLKEFAFNAFTDLEALKEPLEEFDLATVRFRIDEDGTLRIGDYIFLPKRLPDLILNLRRLVATAKRKQDC